MGVRHHLRATRGFTIIEVLVASTLLLVGVLGTVILVDRANAQTGLNKAREGATALDRELLEAARVVPYRDLDSATVRTQLAQTQPPLVGAGTTGAWTITRRNIPYAVTVSVCAIDDPKDGYGSHAGATFCSDSSTVATDDQNAVDFKRITAVATWTRDGQSYQVRQSSLRAVRADPPAVKSLKLAPVPTGVDANAPVITSSTVTSLRFAATTTAPASDLREVTWSIDGADQGNAAAGATAVDWTFPAGGSLDISGWKDGTYTIGARAVDNLGNAGPTRELTLVLSRFAPAAPSGLVAGNNTVYDQGAPTPAIELEWDANAERNVVGYRVRDAGGAQVCQIDRSTPGSRLSCVDVTPTAGAYSVAALYYPSSQALTAGPSTAVTPFRAAYTGGRKVYSMVPGTGTGTGCYVPSSVKSGDLVESSTLGGVTSSGSASAAASGMNFNFCSTPFAVESPVAASSAKAVFGLAHNENVSCTATAELRRNTGTLIDSFPFTVGANSSIRWTLIFGNIAATFAPGDRLNFNLAAGACKQLTFSYGSPSSSSPAEVSFDVLPELQAPTGLQAVLQADGTAKLTWTASPSPAVAFYRIYRDGREWRSPQRYDRTGDAVTTSYVDPNAGGTSHQYWVTAASANLGESAQAGPVAP